MALCLQKMVNGTSLTKKMVNVWHFAYKSIFNVSNSLTKVSQIAKKEFETEKPKRPESCSSPHSCEVLSPHQGAVEGSFAYLSLIIMVLLLR